MARPSVYTKELALEIEEHLANGVPLVRISKMDGMPGYSTLRRWIDENPEFRALSARGKEYGTHYMADDCLRIADDDKIDPANKRIMIDTRLRLIGKWNSNEYGEKIGLAHSGEISVTITEVDAEL